MNAAAFHKMSRSSMTHATSRLSHTISAIRFPPDRL
jgi:hypothetical protein